MSDFKTKLGKGGVIGTMITVMDNPDIMKILQVCGFDYAIIDNEHGSFDYGVVAAMAGLARAIGMPCLVRIPNAGRESVLKYMDAGVAGFLLPNCDSPEEAAELIRHSKYAPMGNRGVSMLRPHAGYESVASVPEYMKRANADGVVICQIESKEGVKNVDAILAVEGVDGVFIGPNDLSQSYGLMGQFDHPVVVGAIDAVIAAAARAGKHSGIHIIGPTANLRKWMDKGMTLNLWSNEIAMLMQAARQGLTELRS